MILKYLEHPSRLLIQIIDSYNLSDILPISFNQAQGNGLLLANQFTEFAESYSLPGTAMSVVLQFRIIRNSTVAINDQ